MIHWIQGVQSGTVPKLFQKLIAQGDQNDIIRVRFHLFWKRTFKPLTDNRSLYGTTYTHSPQGL